MTREQAKEKLIALGIADPTDEQITGYLNDVNNDAEKEKARADKLERETKELREKAEAAEKLEKKIKELEEKDLTEIQKAAKDLEEANKQIAELKKKMCFRK